MKFKVDVDKFRRILKAVFALRDSANITLSEDGIRVKTLDFGNSSMLDLNMPKEMFSEYDVQFPEEIGLDIKNLLNLLKGASGEMEFTKKEDSIEIVIYRKNKKKFS